MRGDTARGASGRTANGRPLRRRYGRREERQTVLVCCEGEKTETSYFKALRSDLRASTVRLEIFSGQGEPYGVVERALHHSSRATREGDPYDQIWCVFDVEAPVPHARLAAAMALATQHGIRCAISNPCFEVWPILHLEDLSPTTYLTTDEACRRLEGHSCGYRRRDKSLDYLTLRPGQSLAVKRAARLDERHGTCPVDARNPSTSVHELVVALLDLV